MRTLILLFLLNGCVPVLSMVVDYAPLPSFDTRPEVQKAVVRCESHVCNDCVPCDPPGN